MVAVAAMVMSVVASGACSLERSSSKVKYFTILGISNTGAYAFFLDKQHSYVEDRCLFPNYLLFSFFSTSLPQYNARIILLKTRAFWRYPLCHSSTGKRGLCSGRLQNTVTTMDADGGNARLTPHTRHSASFQRVRLMGDDPPSKPI